MFKVTKLPSLSSNLASSYFGGPKFPIALLENPKPSCGILIKF